jgi:hypothetical protein
MVLAQAKRTFAVGLGVTMVADAIGAGIAKQDGAPVAVLAVIGAFDIGVLALLVLCGWLSQKRVLPVFALGMFLYLLDGLLCFWMGRVACIVIHAFALWSMWAGFLAYRRLNALERQLLMAGPTGAL